MRPLVKNIGVLTVLSALIILNIFPTVYFNLFTHSLPYGIYMKISGPPHRGEYAASCLSQEIAEYGIHRGYLVPGRCPTGSVIVLKVIKGTPGDHFSVKNGFLEINGNSYAIMDKDSSGRRLKSFYKMREGIIAKGKYLLLSDFVKNSWDSRYWGPVDIQFLLKPLWIFDHVQYTQISHP
jgi:conjugative transfer signal peptidase TraF